MQKHIFVGVDVSKSTLDYIWLPEGKPAQTENSKAGIARFIKKIKKLQPQMVVLEAPAAIKMYL